MKLSLKRRSSGFTLVEALITISIASVLASIAIPSFNNMIASNRISTSSSDFVTALMYARSEATKRSVGVSICPAHSNGTSCKRNTENFALNGWLVFIDCNSNGWMNSAGDCDFDGDGVYDADEILRVEQAISNLSITFSTAKSGRDFFTYLFSGRAKTAREFNIGVDSATPEKVISVAKSGRIKFEDY